MVETLLIVAAVLLALYAAAVLAFVAAGRRTDAAAFARFAPDRVVLIRRLLADPRVPARSRLALGAVLVYLVLPFDVVPNFIPVAGQLDDALVLALVLHYLLRAAEPRAPNLP